MGNNRKKRGIINIVIIIVLVIVIQNIFETTFVKPKNNYNENKITYLLKEIQQNYVDSVSMVDLIESSLEQTLKNLDPHSIYMNKEAVESSMDMMEGSFEGIGVEFSIKNDTIVVINVINDGPSEKKGIKAGDRIVFIEKENVAGIGITNQDVIKKLRGKKGTVVKVGIKNNQEEKIRAIEIKRGKIPLNSVTVAYEISPGIGYIKLDRFSGTTFEEFKNALKKLIKEDEIQNLIFDLRGNSGGYLGQATKVLNEFFDKNKLLVYTKGVARETREYFSDQFGSFKTGEMCILIDEYSASASEIVAGAIQDHDRGFIVGAKSFGKGLVQEQIPFPDGSLFRLTVSRYYTPSGRCIQKPYLNEDDSNYISHQKINTDTITIFKTENGREVFGGGGITPDYTITSDSIPDELFVLYRSDFFNDLAFNYVDNERMKLDQIQFTEFKLNDVQLDMLLNKIDDWILSKFENKIERQKLLEVRKQEKKLIEEHLTALIIRQKWGWEKMRMFLNENDKIITTSLSLFEK